MRYAVIGAGPIGGGFAAMLALGGAEVCVVDHNVQNVEAINANGLHLTYRDNAGSDRSYIANLRAVTDAEKAGISDVVVLSTKATGTRRAVNTIRAVSDKNTLIISNQNGLGSAEILKECFPTAAIARTVVEYGGERRGSGSVFIEASANTVNLPIACDRPGAYEKIAAMSATLSMVGFSMKLLPETEFNRLFWSKLAVNCALNGICALLHCTADDLFASQYGIDLSRAIVKECCSVANAQGIELSPSVIEYIPSIAQKRKNGYRHYPSMVIDFERKRETEIEFLNGAVARAGAALGVPTPYNEAVRYLIRAAQDNWEQL